MPRALDDVRIVDLTRVIAGPYATTLLADMGAQIIKVELPGRGDDGRYGYPTVDGVPVVFLALNRNKKGITLDLRKPRGAELFRKLVRQADVVVENFAAGTMEKWGFGYQALSAINPRLIYAALSGFGQSGPYAQRTSYDIIAQAMGGLMALTGFPDGPPIRGGGALGDFIGGVFTALAVLCALHYRDRTGKGQMVDVSNMDAIFSMLDNWPTVYALTGQLPQRAGNRHPFTAPYDCFHAKDGWVVIGVGNSQLFRTLVTAMGMPELGRDPRFKSPSARLERHDEVNRVVGDWVKEHTVAEVLQVLGPEGANIPCAPVMTLDRLMADPHLRAREMVVDLPHDKLGKVPVTGVPFKLSESPGRIEHLGPELGQHNDEIYGGLLGLSAGEMDELRSEGVI
ncbi:MAG TPA: CoA transferase [Candidatus Margulisiibacteriota bacterium]|nr:CoA transferase [Candidatus Margulisiibacteriota bacterium]